MSRLFVTGDCHGDYDHHKLTTRLFPDQAELTRDDVVLITGDFGVCWDGGKQDQYIQKWHEDKNYTTLSIAGNHENYDILKTLPVVEKWGGKVMQVTPHVFYTITGEVYNIAGYKCLAINGADSHDRGNRTVGKNWWAEETITKTQMADITLGLRQKGIKKIDFVFTHTGGPYVAKMFGFNPTPSDEALHRIFELRAAGLLNYKVHYCGHYHRDSWIFNDTHCLYNCVYEIIHGKERKVLRKD